MVAESATAEWRTHWTVALSAMVGMSFSSLAPSVLGLFIQPLSNQFAWTRAQISLGLSLYALLAVPFSPLIGAWVDRRGPRWIAIPGLVLTTCAFASFSFANGSISQWLGLWLCYAVVALAIKSTVWTAAVSKLFTAGRGLALAVVFCGTAISQALGPILARGLIDELGWRNAYVWLGLGWGGISFLLVAVFFVDARGLRRSRSEDGTGVMAGLSGLTLRKALHSPPLRKIALATLIVSLLIGALIVHQVPILTERGVSRATATLLAAAAGIASLFGKLCTGLLFDHSRSGWIGAISLSLPAVGCALLLTANPSLPTVACAMLILGYAAGAYLQLCTYLTTRYAGLPHFGKIFGVMASVLAIGTGVGPVVGGIVFDHFGSYEPLLRGGILAGLVCGLLVARLGPYPEFSNQSAH